MNDPISCLITDDEPFARKGLQGYVQKTSFLELRGCCEDALQLSERLQEGPVDLLFLDIQMPHLTGIEFLKAVPKPPKVIFTTAYEQYALQGYELDVLDYLLKPISYERFLKAAWKAKDYLTLFKKPKTAADYLFVKASGKLEKVNFDDVLFIEGMENYVSIYLENRKLVVHMTIKALLEQLPEELFLQTHKSYIVAKHKVESIGGNLLHVQKHAVPVSRQLRPQVLAAITNGNI